MATISWSRGGVLFCCILYVVARLVAPHIRVANPQLATLLSAVAFVGLGVLLVFSFALVDIRWPWEIGGAVCGVTAWSLGGQWKRDLLADLGLIFAAIFLGRLVSRLLREPSVLLPVATAAAMVDIWGVNIGGPVKHSLETAPQVIQRATTAVPALGSPQYIAVIGVGDYLFLALLLTALCRHRWNALGAAWCSFGCLLIAMLLVLLWPSGPALPALPFMALGVLAPNRHRFHFTDEEKSAMLWAVSWLMLVLLAAYLALQHYWRGA